VVKLEGRVKKINTTVVYSLQPKKHQPNNRRKKTPATQKSHVALRVGLFYPYPECTFLD